MARTKLPDRRQCTNVTLTHTLAGGKEVKFIATFGLDGWNQVREVFCADFRAGSDQHAIIMDACILLSRLLQHGDTPAEILASMCSPHSLIGTIACAIVREQGQ